MHMLNAESPCYTPHSWPTLRPLAPFEFALLIVGYPPTVCFSAGLCTVQTHY